MPDPESCPCADSIGAKNSPMPTTAAATAETAFLDSETAAATQTANQLKPKRFFDMPAKTPIPKTKASNISKKYSNSGRKERQIIDAKKRWQKASKHSKTARINHQNKQGRKATTSTEKSEKGNQKPAKKMTEKDIGTLERQRRAGSIHKIHNISHSPSPEKRKGPKPYANKFSQIPKPLIVGNMAKNCIGNKRESFPSPAQQRRMEAKKINPFMLVFLRPSRYIFPSDLAREV